MTSSPPEDADRSNREPSATEVDVEFSAIVSGISQQMVWEDSGSIDDAAPARAALLQERDRRRQLRRAQRAEDVTEFEKDQRATEADMLADDMHFVPPEPPPVPKPKRRTVVALIFITLGVLLLLRPNLLQVSANVALVLGIGSLIGGLAILVHGLRPLAGDPNDADGWDDGARL